MFKRLTILALLVAILLVLIVFKSHTTSPVNKPTETSNPSTAYITMEYKITKISDDQYYGKADDGKGIQFSGDKIQPGEKIQVHDQVICYFEKNNLGKGIIKVEKK